jgi:HSP20 family protein
MNAQDDRGGQQGSMGSGQVAGGQAQQAGGGGSQQGGQSTTSRQQGSQQEAYSPGSGQQGGVQQGGAQQGTSLSRRGSDSGSGMPSLFGTRSNPFDMLRRLDEDVDRLFQQIWGGGRSLMRGRAADTQSVWMPQVEMREDGGKLHVCADLPGLKKEDVKLSLEGDQLIVQGERQSSREEGDREGGSFYHSERSYGSFYRSITLPEGVDPQTAQAEFKDGVLDVTFEAPRRPQQQSRQLEIR